MLQCKDCELFSRDDATGRIMLRCDPFSTIKEPECLQKWQLLRLDGLFQSAQATLAWYQKFSPMQEKMFKFIDREMDDLDETESWKYNEDEDEDSNDQGDNPFK